VLLLYGLLASVASITLRDHVVANTAKTRNNYMPRFVFYRRIRLLFVKNRIKTKIDSTDLEDSERELRNSRRSFWVFLGCPPRRSEALLPVIQSK
jgi:hypothetical protein